jgi:hypothetical protein
MFCEAVLRFPQIVSFCLVATYQKIQVHNHCYEATDLDGLVRVSNAFDL